MTRTLLLTWTVLSLFPTLVVAASKSELSDLKRSLDAHRGTIVDMERQDAQRVVTDEITLLRAWVDEAANQLGEEEVDRVREVLDRLNAQEELIRQKMAAAAVAGQAQKREAELAALRGKIEQTKKDIEQANITKKALEMNAK